MKKHLLILFLLQIFVAGCSTVGKKEWGHFPTNYKNSRHYRFYESGYASFYNKTWKGRKTASGEIYDSDVLTAASRTLPFNTKVMVKEAKTGRYVIVRINDRGPYIRNRVIDLSEAAAKKLGITHKGVTKVDIYLVRD